MHVLAVWWLQNSSEWCGRCGFTPRWKSPLNTSSMAATSKLAFCKHRLGCSLLSHVWCLQDRYRLEFPFWISPTFTSVYTRLYITAWPLYLCRPQGVCADFLSQVTHPLNALVCFRLLRYTFRNVSSPGREPEGWAKQPGKPQIEGDAYFPGSFFSLSDHLLRDLKRTVAARASPQGKCTSRRLPLLLTTQTPPPWRRSSSRT